MDRGGLMPEARLSKEEVKYRHNEKCSACDYFVPTGHCERVAGSVSPDMVCDKWEVKSMYPVGKDREFYEQEYSKRNK